MGKLIYGNLRPWKAILPCNNVFNILPCNENPILHNCSEKDLSNCSESSYSW